VAAALRLDVPFRAAELTLPIESPLVDELLASARQGGPAPHPLIALGRLDERGVATVHATAAVSNVASGNPRATTELSEDDDQPRIERRAIAAALMGWAASCRSLDDLEAAIQATRQRLNDLRRDDALLLLATAHGTKGLEFDHVAVIGMDDGRFPSARSVAEAIEPERAMEEERRLAYVAWTRARRSLTLVYDPGAPSQFLREAFDAEELGGPSGSGAATAR
jgi:superfamily I DNA/RNA helicase